MMMVALFSGRFFSCANVCRRGCVRVFLCEMIADATRPACVSEGGCVTD